MHSTSYVAQLIATRIKVIGKSQKDISREAGFKRPNMISMIKRGETRLPLNKAVSMAIALEMDPVQLLKMCIKEYQPSNWRVIEPLMDFALTEDELRLLNALRVRAGNPSISAISEESRLYFDKFIDSLHAPAI